MARPVSRRKTPIVSGDSAITKRVNKNYCRFCQCNKAASKFYDAVDTYLDKNGKMSICIDCINEIFDKNFALNNDVSKTILVLCRMLNVAYLDSAVQAAILHVAKLVEKTGNMTGVFGIYKSKLTSFAGLNQTSVLTITEPSTHVSDVNYEEVDEHQDAEYLKQFWGENMSLDDYAYLERELDDWEKTHKHDSKAEITLLKEICLQQLVIRKERQLEHSLVAPLKLLQDLMKTANVDPAKASLNDSGKSQDTFSGFVKMIEENEPADYYKDKGLFKDYDNIEWYFDKYVRRPLKNFVTGSRDFDVTEDNDDTGDDDNSIMASAMRGEGDV